MHYETWDLIAQDPHAWAERVRQETNTQPHVMQIGETYTVPE